MYVLFGTHWQGEGGCGTGNSSSSSKTSNWAAASARSLRREEIADVYGPLPTTAPLNPYAGGRREMRGKREGEEDGGDACCLVSSV